MAIPASLEHSKLWAITAYFNPMRYRRRQDNYHLFRRRLNVPLLTVELSFHDGYELEEKDADILVRLRGGDVLWQKERLLNLALTRLPRACDKVAWLDCDILFDSFRWADDVEKLLDHYPLVQIFKELIHLELGGEQLPCRLAPEGNRRTSLAHGWIRKTVPQDNFRWPDASSRYRCNSGMAWAGRRDLLENHGLYDAMVLGMGDKGIAAAAVGRFEDAARAHRMNPQQMNHYLQWAARFHDEIRGQLGYWPGTIFHLWHGELADRHYVDRYEGFDYFAFDPHQDLAIDSNGCWRWNTEKPELHRHVANYFRLRQEDGRDSSPQKIPKAA